MEKEPGDQLAMKNEDRAHPKEYFCGLGKCCRPKLLQIFRNAKFFTFLLCCYSFIQGAVATGFVAAILSTIELRYQLSSLQIGLIPSVLDIAVLVSVVFVSYFGGRGHKPRWLGFGLLVIGLGSLVFALPQFVFGEYSVGAEGTATLESCNDGITFPTDCNVNERNRLSLIFFYIGTILIGVGSTPLYTVGPSYVDDIVRPKFVSIHLAMFLGCSVLGPALGFGLGAAFLSVYVDFWVDTTLVDTDPGYVGAWWLCFLFSTVVCWFLSIPLFMFPKLLPDSHLVKAEREKEMAQKYKMKEKVKKWANTQDDSDENVTLRTNLVSFPQHLLQVVTTPSWVFITIALSFSFFMISGVIAFAPKFIEAQFSLTPAVASITAGLIAIPAGTAGVLIGGLLISFTKSNGRSAALINWVVSLLAVPTLMFFLARCPTVQLAGINVPFFDGAIIEGVSGPTISSCNSNCSCTSPIYEPVCGRDDVTYFTPCAAGCVKTFRDNDTDTPVFENCTCVQANLEAMMSNLSLGDVEDLADLSTAEVGVCDNGCYTFGIFVAVGIISIFMIFMLEVPNIVVTIRCVADEQRSLALGLQSAIFRMFGSVPGPIVFGAIFDSACIYFRFDTPCMKLGNCWVYDNLKLSWSIVIMVLIGIAANFTFSFLAWFFYPKQNASTAAAAGGERAAAVTNHNASPTN